MIFVMIYGLYGIFHGLNHQIIQIASSIQFLCAVANFSSWCMHFVANYRSVLFGKYFLKLKFTSAVLSLRGMVPGAYINKYINYCIFKKFVFILCFEASQFWNNICTQWFYFACDLVLPCSNYWHEKLKTIYCIKLHVMKCTFACTTNVMRLTLNLIIRKEWTILVSNIDRKKNIDSRGKKSFAHSSSLH